MAILDLRDKREVGNLIMKNKTVSQALYARLVEVGDFVPSGAIEEWGVLGATGSTITRKLRLLAESGYLEVKHIDGHSHYKANRVKKAPQTPLIASEKPVEEKVRYFIVNPVTGEKEQVV